APAELNAGGAGAVGWQIFCVEANACIDREARPTNRPAILDVKRPVVSTSDSGVVNAVMDGEVAIVAAADGGCRVRGLFQISCDDSVAGRGVGGHRVRLSVEQVDLCGVVAREQVIVDVGLV